MAKNWNDILNEIKTAQTRSLTTVFLAIPVIRQVARMLFPSTRAEMTWTRCWRLSLFILTIMLDRACKVKRLGRKKNAEKVIVIDHRSDQLYGEKGKRAVLAPALSNQGAVGPLPTDRPCGLCVPNHGSGSGDSSTVLTVEERTSPAVSALRSVRPPWYTPADWRRLVQ